MNFKQKFNAMLDEIEPDLKQLSQEARMQTIEELIEDYIEQNGERPDGDALYRLTDLILYDELSDRSKNKAKDDSYPFLSDKQIGRRQEGKDKRRNSEGVLQKEVPIDHAFNVGTDGRDYTLPIRSFSNSF